MADKALDVYLNDHLAGAMFGADLARQLAARTTDTAAGPSMRRLADEISEDRETLRALMARAHTARNPVKQATTWVAEKLSRVKMLGYSHGEEELGLFMSLETLSLGIEGKAALWTTLAEVSHRYPGLAGFDFASLHGRALSQRQVLERQRAEAAARAFGPR